MAFVETVFIEGSTGAVLDGVPGSAAPANAVQVGGSDGTNLRVIATDSSGQVKVLLENSVPAGTNLIGQVEVSDGTNILGTSAHPVRIDPTGTTIQPISGTVTANQGTANTVGNAWPNKITDGTNTAAVKAASTAAAATDPAVVVAVSPNNSVAVTGTFFQATQPVSLASTTITGSVAVTGTFWQATQPVSIASSVAVTGTFWQSTQPVSLAATVTTSDTNLVAQASTTSGQKGPLVQGAVTTSAPTYTTAQTSPLSLTTAGALRVDGSAVTQPVSIAASVTVAQGTAANLNATVSGTVTSIQGTANTAANAWPHKITDGTNIAAVKAASTAAAATDPALVVAVSPNNSVAVTQATAANLNATAVLAAGTATIGSVKITDGTTVATVIAGTTALKTDLSSVAGTATVTAASGVQKVGVVGGAGTSLETTAGVLDHNLKNINNATVVTAASGVQKVGVVGNAGATLDATVAAGTAPTNGVAVLSQFNTTAPAPTAAQTVALQSNSAGALLISSEGNKATYRVAFDGTTLASSQVSYLLVGSGTKTIRVTKIELRMSSSAAAATGLIVTQFFSPLPTAGTFTTVGAVPVDPNDSGATAVFRSYSVAPSGSTAANYDAIRLTTQGSSTVLQSGSCLWQSRYGDGGKYPILRGTTQGFALAFSTAQSATGFFEWTEE